MIGSDRYPDPFAPKRTLQYTFDNSRNMPDTYPVAYGVMTKVGQDQDGTAIQKRSFPAKQQEEKMNKMKVSVIAAVIIGSVAGSAFARVPDRGEFYQGIQRQASNHVGGDASVDKLSTGSINKAGARHETRPVIKGGEGNYYQGIQRN